MKPQKVVHPGIPLTPFTEKSRNFPDLEKRDNDGDPNIFERNH